MQNNFNWLKAAPVTELGYKALSLRMNNLIRQGIVPHMVAILVGDNPSSVKYVENKKKQCQNLGAKFSLKHLAENTSENEFLGIISEINKSSDYHGAIIQLPLPPQLRHLDVSRLIIASKDIDGFHPDNVFGIYQGSKDLNTLIPCTPKGIIRLLQHYHVELKSKNIVVIGRSLIVGKPLALLLTNFDATVTMAHSKTQNLKTLTQNADIVICATGQPKMLNQTFFQKDNKTIVIDVGINLVDGKWYGDVDPNGIETTTRSMTPVPGGIGPMTVLSLMENLIIATEKQILRK